jgi:hypothetical protein
MLLRQLAQSFALPNFVKARLVEQFELAPQHLALREQEENSAGEKHREKKFFHRVTSLGF